jgi:hypothetical protein
VGCSRFCVVRLQQRAEHAPPLVPALARCEPESLLLQIARKLSRKFKGLDALARAISGVN